MHSRNHNLHSLLSIHQCKSDAGRIKKVASLLILLRYIITISHVRCRNFGSCTFFCASSDENAVLARAFEEHRDSRETRPLFLGFANKLKSGRQIYRCHAGMSSCKNGFLTSNSKHAHYEMGTKHKVFRVCLFGIGKSH